ncbi:disease resistance protein RGA2-like [Quercus lobata]|nr:disease resistance protein RGA2-like [Quercus lobata]XP_030958028.1 disease resistance protein RGA2-like [Quercus lobata]XP_030958029.1 disease resistance protein RGA2-like [Quercus lobata]XP_030958030.1 disease resistance protein RGA2-like [Quercus lobata]XP_030958031.1 disease resistance protein RGA2-like [Quercus lobata]XP_030958032.1 disease resistance protein RGA2-like [Quercus lobata]XP_030958033.1 disease resistance protein RGA2-like [Quercus lobata]XP_030958034.1 disease resistanc
MAVALLSAILERLGSLASSEFKLTVTVKEEVQKLASKFRTIQAVLNDAEKRQLKEEAVKLWFEKLEGVSYEIDDVLDEWDTVMIKAEIEKQQKEFEEEEKAETSTAKKRNVWHFTPNFNSSVPDLFQHRDIAHQIKDLNEKLHEIIKEKQMFEFKVSRPIEDVFERPKTTSYVDVSEILGRGKVKNDLVSILLGKGTEKEKYLHVISLVGMGGIGKTTLAQLAYNDKEVQAHFEIKVWVCVSDPFDQCKVGKEILECVERQSPNLTALQSLLDRICDKVRGKKFFLVFDDVWTEDYAIWKPFRDALKSCGSKSSRILVTTRKYQVAKMMESANTIKLNELSEEDCWLVFSKIAFFDRDPQECEQLEDFGRQISKKCKGLPLAAKTLGSLMRFKKSREEWRYVLNNNLWEFEDVERGLFAPLLMSYFDLSSPLKRCFSYCAVFPKDHVFDVDELVYMWTAHGFVESKGNMEVEIKAREYFENLVIRSFFLECKEDKWFDEHALSNMSTRYKMHDIVHDFAQSITKACHLGYSTASQFPPSADISKNLRTVIFFNQCDYNMSNLVQNFSLLRVLTLTSGMEIPDTIGNLIHLRYLNLIWCKKIFSSDKYPFKWVLPETICNLCNLQFLRLDCNNISILPQKIGKLINLRLLTGGYLVIPREIGRLTSLRTLDRVLISDKDSERCEFEGLKNLKHLRDLSLLCFGSTIFPQPDRRTIESNLLIFNALEPPQELEKLRISNYGGTTMSPIWLASLTNLKELHLDDAVELMSLPPLGNILPCLESLTITRAWWLKKVGVEFLGIESENKKEDIKIFPNLKYLEFKSLWVWEEWIGGTREGGQEDEDCITIMPRLQKLKILYCTKLKSLPDFLRTTPLKELEIKGCPIIMKCCRTETGEYWHNISHIPIIKLLDDPEDMTRGCAEDEEDASDFEPEENGSEEEEIDEEDEDKDGGEG